MDKLAVASPSKLLFLEIFTRDLSLEDCILDLLDNSVDSLIRSRNIDLSAALLPLDTEVVTDELVKSTCSSVDVKWDENQFEIKDNCGGISVKEAETEVFRFGHSSEASPGQLGVYGVGLKRAIFKIGTDITIESRTKNEGWRMHIDVNDWSSKAKENDWTLPFEVIEGAGNGVDAGTTIRITSFREEVVERLKSGSFEGHLKEVMGRTYGLFLNRFVIATVNGMKVIPTLVPLASSTKANIAKKEYQDGEVMVTIYAGLAARDAEGHWREADAGWYVSCNGRLVVLADKTDTTGWGSSGLPMFVPKYRGFIGMVFFRSTNPLKLPWTTTKQGLNRESLVFQNARGEMALVGRPVLTFLDNMYPTSVDRQREAQREVAEGVIPVDVRALTVQAEETFSASVTRPRGEPTTSVQFDIKDGELARARRVLGRGWSARKIAMHAFQHFLKTECPE